MLQVLPALESGGVERGAVDIARALADAGWRALVASTGGALTHEIERAGAEHLVLPLASKNPFVMRSNVGRLARLIESEGVDLVHARSRAPAWSALYAARRTGRPLVTTFHGAYNFANAIKRRYNAVMARGDRVIAISGFIAEHLHEHYRIADARLRVVRRGIDLDIFDPARVSAERLVQLAGRWRLPDDAPVVMLPGRLTHWKGHRVLIDALAILGRKDLRCLFVGPDQGRRGYRRELEAQIGRRGLEGVVHFVDHCRDMPAAYMLADVVVSASLDPEAFGRIIVEAQAMGRPTIASDHGAARETVVPGVTGWLTPPGEEGALARTLETALDLYAAARERLAARAISRARADYDRRTMCAATLDIYRELLDGETGAPRAEAAQ
ncbi:MAG: glycosyltransferase family 4 protein [Alphaproteobacteria bacterium]